MPFLVHSAADGDQVAAPGTQLYGFDDASEETLGLVMGDVQVSWLDLDGRSFYAALDHEHKALGKLLLEAELVGLV